ncbi:hypothetical protein ACS0TY_001694 [Phlomoides rotata]
MCPPDEVQSFQRKSQFGSVPEVGQVVRRTTLVFVCSMDVVVFNFSGIEDVTNIYVGNCGFLQNILFLHICNDSSMRCIYMYVTFN